MTNIGEAQEFLTGAAQWMSEDCLIWPFCRNQKGYALININGSKLVHRLVCREAHGPAPNGKPNAAHSCGMGHLGCINWKHLRWTSHKENERDKIKHGTNHQGERHGMAKLTNDDVITIRSLRCTTQKDIAEHFGISISQVCAIRKLRNWGWLRKYQ